MCVSCETLNFTSPVMYLIRVIRVIMVIRSGERGEAGKEVGKAKRGDRERSVRGQGSARGRRVRVRGEG